MKNANARVLIVVLALIAAVAAAGLWVGSMEPADEAPRISERVTITPSAPEKDADTRAYLRIQVGSDLWPLIPLTDGGEYEILQSDTGARNVVHTTREGAVMHFSTCENQNCVEQGEMTLSNLERRAMGNLIVCLPNQVVVELVNAEEVP